MRCFMCWKLIWLAGRLLGPDTRPCCLKVACLLKQTVQESLQGKVSARFLQGKD